MLIESVKAALFIFPFIKEIFLGKDKPKTPGQPGVASTAPTDISPRGRFMRQFLITVAILSVILNVLLIEKLIAMGSSMVTIKHEIAVLRKEAKTNPKEGDDLAQANALRVGPTEEQPAAPVVIPAPTPPPVQAASSAPAKRSGHPKPVKPTVATVPEQAGPLLIPPPNYGRLRQIDDIK